MADDLDDVAEPEELDPEDLEDLGDEELLDEEDLDVALVDEDDDAVIDIEPVVEAEPDAVVVPVAAVVAAEEGDEEEEEVEDEDVEASLDEILKERLVVEEEEAEDEEVVEPDDRTEGTERVLPKQPDEFVCSSCFLVKHSSQLADPEKGLCRDCV